MSNLSEVKHMGIHFDEFEKRHPDSSHGRLSKNLSPYSLPETNIEDTLDNNVVEMTERNSLSPHVTNNVSDTFRPLPYFSNYYSILDIANEENNLTNRDNNMINDIRFLKHSISGNHTSPSTEIDSLCESSSIENEFLLKKYYEAKKALTITNIRHGSVISSTDSSKLQSDKAVSNTIIDEFVKNTRLPKDTHSIGLNGLQASHSQSHGLVSDMVTTRSASSYFKYHEKLSDAAIQSGNPNIIKKHTLWVPSVREEFRNLLLYNRRHENYNTEEKTSCLFIDGESYLSSKHDFYSGSTMIPSLFSEFKLPSFTYHCTVDMDDQIFILGGLLPSYRYDEEAPSLKDFEVDGLKNLPPPLLESVVNNPSLIENPHIYTLSSSNSHVKRPIISGSIPPPLLCAQATKINDTNIFYYGGFEIKTEAHYNPTTKKYHIKRRMVVNNNGYVLDIITLNFTKIDIMVQQSKHSSYPNLAARFGHVQVYYNKRIIPNIMKRNDSNNSDPSYPGKSDIQASHYNISQIIKSAEMRRSTSIPYQQKTNTSTIYSPTLSTSNLINETDSLLDSPRGSINSTVKSSNTISQEKFSVYIYGGYTQRAENDFIALDDMWKIEILVLSRTKRGRCKFGDTAAASMIATHPSLNCDANSLNEWPEARGFPAFLLYTGTPCFNYGQYESDLLKNLELNFNIAIESDTIKGPNDNSQSVEEFVNNRNNSSNRNTGSEYSLRRVIYQNTDKNKETILMHGGSVGSAVLGDLWWFDFEKEKWTRIETFARIKSDTYKIVSIQLPKVGHIMIDVSSLMTLYGGFNQHEVDLIYKKKPMNKLTNNPLLGSTLLNSIDLDTQCLYNKTVFFKDDGTMLVDDMNTDEEKRMMVSIGGTLTRSNGLYQYIGGLFSRNTALDSFYLRGTILTAYGNSSNFLRSQ